MKQKQIITFLLLLLCGSGFSQTASLPLQGGNPISDRGGFSSNAAMLSLINSLDKIQKTSVYENIAISDIEGSMFFDPNFVEGIVYLNGERFTSYPIRYNALNDEFEVKADEGSSQLQVLAKTKSVACKKGNNYFVFTDYVLSNGESRSGYLIRLVSGEKYSLYEKRAKVFKEGSDAKTSFHKSTPHRFLDKIDFYLAKGDNSPIHIKPTKKSVLSLLDKEDALKLRQFLKNKRGLDFSKKEELMGIIAYVNSN